MRFSPPTSVGWSVRFFGSILLASAFVNSIAIPVLYEKDLQFRDVDVSTLIIPEVAHVARSQEQEVQEFVVRATKKGKSKTRKKKPKTTPTKPKQTPTGTKPTNKATPSVKPKPDSVPSEARMMKQCKVPKDKAFFWSGAQTQGKKYARQFKLTMDEDAFPKGFVDRFSGDDGKPRDEKKWDVFTRRFSKVFATKATGIVHVMVPWATGPKANRVFHANEWPVLKKRHASGQITKIIQVNPEDFNETRDYSPKPYGLTKRAAEIDITNVSWDVDLDALSEKWQEVHGERVHEVYGYGE
jgi:hypothetical protein